MKGKSNSNLCWIKNSSKVDSDEPNNFLLIMIFYYIPLWICIFYSIFVSFIVQKKLK